MSTPNIEINFEIPWHSYVGTIASTSANRVDLAGKTVTTNAIRLPKGVYTVMMAWRGSCLINAQLYNYATSRAAYQGGISAGSGYRSAVFKISCPADCSLYFVPAGQTTNDLNETLSLEIMPAPAGIL